ncbi:MAG: glycosyltransferase [Candidatus Eisenbacteria bacterium]
MQPPDALGGVRTVRERLRVASPVTPPGSERWLRAWARAILLRTAFSPDAVLVYLPSWAPVVEMLPRAHRIYHCVDAYAENPGVDRARVETMEKRLLRSVDLVLTASAPLRHRLAPLHPHVLPLPNVADVERFARDPGPIPPDLQAIAPPRLLYLGNLAAYKIDLDRIARLARARPDWSWVLVGPAGRGDPSTRLSILDGIDNVHRLGERDRSAAPSYVAHADVCVLPLRDSASTRASFPLKTFEYLAAGRPVVATPIPALEPWIAQGIVRGAREDEDWIAGIAEAFAGRDDPAAVARRRHEASRHGWSERIEEIEKLLSP